MIGVDIGVRAWRQIAVAIDHRKLQGVGEELERLYELWESDNANRATGNLVHDMQAAHSTRTGRQLYGNSIVWGATLNDTALDAFRNLSIQWHGLAGLAVDASPSSPQQATGCAKKRPLSGGLPPSPRRRGRLCSPERTAARHSWGIQDL